MRIVSPAFKFQQFSRSQIISDIADAARTCYKSEPNESTTKLQADKELVEMLMKRRHYSVIEHASLSCRIVCDRGISHEIVRHRLAAYSQESTRYCNYEKSEHVTFIRPSFFPHISTGEFCNFIDLPNFNQAESVWLRAMFMAETSYFELIRSGSSPQQARSVLPNSLKTEIVMTCNLREWMHFFKMRADSKAHPQMIELAAPMLSFMRMQLPEIFEYVVPFSEDKNDAQITIKGV